MNLEQTINFIKDMIENLSRLLFSVLGFCNKRRMNEKQTQ